MWLARRLTSQPGHLPVQFFNITIRDCHATWRTKVNYILPYKQIRKSKMDLNIVALTEWDTDQILISLNGRLLLTPEQPVPPVVKIKIWIMHCSQCLFLQPFLFSDLDSYHSNIVGSIFEPNEKLYCSRNGWSSKLLFNVEQNWFCKNL